MAREGNSDPIPIDIILDILSRSSTKEIARFGLASKFCASILNSQNFTELFLTRSLTSQPRLLFAIKNSGDWCFYSSPQLHNLDENHSLVVSADLHMQLPGDMGSEICGPVSGLFYFPNMRRSEVPVICNPSTGQYARLPQLKRKRDSRSLLGYDPIGKRYKVSNIRNSIYGASNEEGHIMTLGTGKMSWRKLHCPENHYPIGEGVCIDGVLYYIAGQAKGVKLACFDVRNENFRFLKTDSIIRKLLVSSSSTSSSTKLIKYKGKLGVISWRWDSYVYGRARLCLQILEDAQDQKWLEHRYTFPVNIVVKGDVSVVGVTATNEIILSMDYTSKAFFVFYFNPERRTLERVRVQGFEAFEKPNRVYTFVDYAEDFKFITESS
ncbi:unnamed protein product [Arabidopsis lyrata]|nr:putative F-box protein At5g52620 [Arabidopsis lyrata subsp. lyrata]CAH8263949.1 unnamed protein product [Arabidopsis lyrata]|eukprot:XP_002879129.2 putative F-box protein At5g52620 [Arabidopsis lyrata subsp. lyrata]